MLSFTVNPQISAGIKIRLRHRAGWLEAIKAPIIWSVETAETRHGMTTECPAHKSMYQMAIGFMSRFSGAYTLMFSIDGVLLKCCGVYSATQHSASRRTRTYNPSVNSRMLCH